MLRKLGVATKPKSKKSKATSHPVLPPPTPREVKERATKRIVSEKQRKQTERRFENSGSESEDSDDFPIISVKRAIQPSAETSRAQTGPTATTPTNVDFGSDQDTIPALGGDLDRNPRDPSTSNPGDQTQLPAPGKKKGPTTRKARLVSYSSQGDSHDETASTTSRKNGRKRTAVTKMGGVMIDFINQNEKEGKK